MNMKIKIIGASLVLLSFILTLGFVSAYRGDVTKAGPYYDAEVHDNIQAAIKDGNYQAWRDLMLTRGNSKITTVVTENNFSEYSAAYLDALSGDSTSLINFRESNGFGSGMKNRPNNRSLLGNNLHKGANSSINKFQYQKNRNNSNCIYN